jgi:hypothetical protein
MSGAARGQCRANLTACRAIATHVGVNLLCCHQNTHISEETSIGCAVRGRVHQHVHTCSRACAALPPIVKSAAGQA